MKVEALKAQCAIFGLDQQGKKAILVDRLSQLLESQTVAQDVDAEDLFDAADGDDGDDGAADSAGEGAGGGDGAAELEPTADPLTASLLMGVPAEWFEVACVHCNVRLMARLPSPMTALSCQCCSGTFAVRNSRAPQPKRRLRRKRVGNMPKAQREFMSAELVRLAKEGTVPAKEHMGEAMKRFKAQPPPPPPPPPQPPPEPAAPPTPPPPPPPPLPPPCLPTTYNDHLGVVPATLVSGGQQLRKTGVCVLGMQISAGPPVPPPFVAMPLSERPKKAAHKRKAREAPATGTQGGGPKRQRRRPVTP